MAYQQQQHQQHHHQPGQQPRGGFNPNNPVRVSARKFDFDLLRKDWVCTPTTINVTRPSGYFDSGGMRVCYFVQEVEEDGCTMDCVAKFFKTDIPDVVHADYLNEAMAQCLSEEFAQNFNKKETPKKISFLNCSVIVVEERDTPPLHMLPQNNFFTFRTQDTKRVAFCMEPKLNGEFTKYNSNFGDCYANNKRDAKKGEVPKHGLDSVFVSAEAFSHFTLQESGGSFLVCDLQGVEDMLTDPQIHTEEGKGLGMGNMGQEGIDKWWASHKCNAICQTLGLKSFNEILNPPPAQHLIDAAQGGGAGGPPPAAGAGAGHGSPQAGPPAPLPSSAGQHSGHSDNVGLPAQKPTPAPKPGQVPPPPGTWGSLYSNESTTNQPPQQQPTPQQQQQQPPLLRQDSSRSRYHDVRNSMYATMPEGHQPSMRPSQRHLFQGKQPGQPGQQQPGQQPAPGGPGMAQPQPTAGFPGHQVQQGQPQAGATGSFLPPPNQPPNPASPYGQNQQPNHNNLGYGQQPGAYQQQQPPQQQPPQQQPPQQQQQPHLYGGVVPPGPVSQGNPVGGPPQPNYGHPQQQQQQQQSPPPAQQGGGGGLPAGDPHNMSEEDQLRFILERSKLDR